MGDLITKLGTRILISDKSKRIQGLRKIAEPLSEQHIQQAATKFDTVNGETSSFKDSTNFDVIIDTKRYPPKAILGIALSDYYGVDILPEHFSGGEKSSCFRILRDLGFETVDKEGTNPKRENEVFDYSSFTVGELHTKLEAFERAGVWVPNHARDIPGPTGFSNCVVLFVTLEKERKELEHKYDDKFFLGGSMFQWESQNKNTPDTPHMMMIIDGEPVVLFARVHEKIKSKSQPFTYVGQLGYVKHSYPIDSKDNPVEVIFEVSEHQNPASDTLSDLYEWSPGIDPEDKPIDISRTILNETSVPTSSGKAIAKRGKTRGTKKTNWAERDERNRNLGLAGEKLVVEHEIQRLTDLGLIDLAKRVEHVAISSDGDGYDVLSFDDYGVKKYIEVKTTKQSKGTAFFISRNEVEVSREKGEQYWIYRVYALKGSSSKASFYALQGPVDKHFDLIPESYKALPK